MKCIDNKLMPCCGDDCQDYQQHPIDKADSPASPLDELVRTQHVLQVQITGADWWDVQVSETLESAQVDIDYWKRKYAKPVRAVKRTDTLIAL